MTAAPGRGGQPGQHDESLHPRAGDGKFATKNLEEAGEVDLNAQDNPDNPDNLDDQPAPHQSGDPVSLTLAARLFNDVDEITADLTDATEERSLVDRVLVDQAEASFIVLRGYNQETESFDRHGPDAWMDLYDANDESLTGGGLAPFRPASLDRLDPGENEVAIGVEEACGRDIDAVRRQCERDLVERVAGPSAALMHEAAYERTLPHFEAAAEELERKWGETPTASEIEAARIGFEEDINSSNVRTYAQGYERRAQSLASSRLQQAVLDRPRKPSSTA